MNFKNILLGQMAADDMALLAGALSEVSLDREDRLANEGESPQHLYFPSTCVTSVVTVMRDGRSVETSTIGYESAPAILSVLTGAPTHSRVFIQVGGSAMRVPAPVIRKQALASPGLMTLLLRFAQANAYQAELSVACNALHQVEARMARWLLLTQDRASSATIPLTQEFLAIMLGVQRTSVTATALALKKRNLIKYNRGLIQILDRDGLIETACECYADSRAISEATRS